MTPIVNRPIAGSSQLSKYRLTVGDRCFVANRFAGNLNLTNQVEGYMSTNDRFIQGGPQIASLENYTPIIPI